MSYIPAALNAVYDIDWTTLGAGKVLTNTASNGKPYSFQAAPVTNVTGTGNISSTGGITPNIGLTGVVGVSNGGTGFSSYTPGSLLCPSGPTTMSTINPVAIGSVLVSNGTSATPQWTTAPGFQGANITSGTIPNSALITTPVTSVTASGNLSSSGGTTPAITCTASPTFTTITASTGLSLTANPGGGTAATLNDYEVGTWTPTDQSGASLTFSTAIGSYIKIGRLVWITANIVYPTTVSASVAQVSLPFTPISSSSIVGLSLAYSSVSVAILPNVATTTFVRFNGGLNGSTLGVTNSVMSAQQTQFTGTYQSAA